MVMRTSWQDKYGVAGNVVGISTKADFASDAAKIGITADDQFGLPLTGSPDIAPNPEFSDSVKTTGLAQVRTGTGYERTKFINRPTFSFEYPEVEAYGAAFFLWSLFQKGGSESGTAQTYQPSTLEGADVTGSGEAEFWLSLTRAMSTSTADWQAIHGAIATSITFSSEEGGPLSMSGELIAAEYEAPMTPGASAYASQLALPAKAPLLHQNLTALLAGTAMNIPSWSVTLTNNAVMKFYDEDTGQKIVVGRITGTGSFTLPWHIATVGDDEQVKNFVAGTDVLVQISWGSLTGATEGDLGFHLNCHYTGAPLDATDEISTALEFELAADGTNQAVKVVSNNNYALGI